MHLCEKVIKKERLFDGMVFSVERRTVEQEDGRTALRDIVLHNGGAGILPIDENGNVTLVRQYRSGTECVLTEICAGKLEDGEDPRQCALRELGEELGLTAESVVDMGCLIPTPAYDSERIYIYLARGLHPTERHLDDGEFVDIVTMSLEDALAAADRGEITDSKTQIALYRAERLINGTR